MGKPLSCASALFVSRCLFGLLGFYLGMSRRCGGREMEHGTACTAVQHLSNAIPFVCSFDLTFMEHIMYEIDMFFEFEM